MIKILPILFITGLWIISCQAKNSMETNSSENIEVIEDKKNSEEDRIINLLYAVEKNYSEVLFMKKVNFGIPGGDNWLVEWKPVRSYDKNSIIIYSISEKIEKRFYLNMNFTLKDFTDFDIMKDIPGIHIGSSSIFDFNNDGMDELFQYGFYGNGFFISIYGYNGEKDAVIDYCGDMMHFEIIDKLNGPAPVEFTTYKGNNGLKVYSSYYSKIPPVNLINNYYAWYFFTWNSETEQYENMGEYLVNESGDEIEIKYNIHDYPVEHFVDRINHDSISNMELLVNLVEINAEIQGGRSFKATIMAASDKHYFENTFHFDSEGRLVRRVWN